MNEKSNPFELENDDLEKTVEADTPDEWIEDTFETPSDEQIQTDKGIESIFIHEEDVEVKEVPIRKERKIRLGSVITFVLAVTMIGGGAYTVGYYNGQINLKIGRAHV